MSRSYGGRRLVGIAGVILMLAAGACASKASKTTASANDPYDLTFEPFTEPPASESPLTFTEVVSRLGAGWRVEVLIVLVGRWTGHTSLFAFVQCEHGARAEVGPSGRVYWPSGRVSTEITDVSVNDNNEVNKDGEREWSIVVRGLATNGTSAPVRNIEIRVVVATDNADTDVGSAVISPWVGAGASANWREDINYDSEEKPDDDDVTATVTGWSWGDSYSSCPT